MIELTQTKLIAPKDMGKKTGNCYATCIAMIFELDPALLPHTPDDDLDAIFAVVDPDGSRRKDYPDWTDKNWVDDYWWKMWAKWFKENNLRAITFDHKYLNKYDILPKLGWCMLHGVSPRDRDNGKMLHSVVGYEGRIWFDPHPSRRGILTIEEAEIIIPDDPSKPILEGYHVAFAEKQRELAKDAPVQVTVPLLTYTVVEIHGSDFGWRWMVAGYRGKDMLLETKHKDAISKDIECRTWEGRGHSRRD
jgi:hypothetical protein